MDTSSGTTFDSRATYTCDTGYTLSGSQSRTCRADGTWTLSKPLCEGIIRCFLLNCFLPDLSSFAAVECGPLTDPDNGHVDMSEGITFGSTATYTCDTGYTLSGGSQSRTCGADGTWTLSKPLCEGIFIKLFLA